MLLKMKKKQTTWNTKIKLESELRDDYRTDSKTYLELKRQSDIIKNSLDDPSAAATLASAIRCEMVRFIAHNQFRCWHGA